ncbi:MAG TPA: SpoIIE family protein phosphatase [Candidatus Acidoferrales bacterium]|nr:SpoIIE family protein phosphatase [Candidatus Acidoferrales bacterium]
MKRYRVNWRRVGRIEKTFLVFAAIWVLLYLTGSAPALLVVATLAMVVSGGLAAYKLSRRAIRTAIWRLRNRLIAAYLFIAVVPIVLILVLMGLAAWFVLGQMAVYLVDTELSARERTLSFVAETLSRGPVQDQAVSNRVLLLRRSFPDFEMLGTGQSEFRFPPDSKLRPLPAAWKNGSGLVTKQEGDKLRLYAWARAEQNGSAVSILAPLTHDLLTGLVKGLGDVSFQSGFLNLTGRSRSRIPEPANIADFRVSFLYPVAVPSWEAPEKPPEILLMVVETRVASVLGIVFGQKEEWSERIMEFLVAASILLLLVELASLWAGVMLSRSITGAVHELYEGTQHVRRGDFSYRIPVKGDDQLGDLTTSFNTMTENLAELIVVAKEKERLESELSIAREVQNQLFPKDVPFTKTLELKGVCAPARMVSGDYYDFMSLSENTLAFAIGDVAGKGISAALLMATIQSTMRTQLSATNGVGPHHYSAARLVSNLNKQLYATTAPEKYATFYFAVYEDATHSLTYTNAGHLAPMLLRGSNIQMLDSTGTVVGAFPIARYLEKTVALEHGDLLVAYTDGVTEPENVYGEMFGEDRLKDMLIKYSGADSSELIARTMESVVQWTGSSELQDDMTMVVARRL